MPGGAIDTAALRDVLASLPTLDPNVSDDERIDRIRLLEAIKAAAAAAQVAETAAFVTSQRVGQARSGLSPDKVGHGIASQVALARRISPASASRYVGWAMILPAELPHTFAALQSGQTSEWRAMTVARESLFLSREHRLQMDAELGPRLEGLADRQVEGQARSIACRLDPQGAVERASNAVGDRHVSIRPAPDVMARLTALMPAADAVATYAALTKEADRLRAQGDPRGRGQLMADLLFQRVTGQADANGLPAEICLVMTDAALLADASDEAPGADADRESAFDQSGSSATENSNAELLPELRSEPAVLQGYGPVPAPWARDLVYGRGESGAPVWLRRLFRGPKTGELVAMETRHRLFTPGQRRFITLRDGGCCRTPWCAAPIRHIDHVAPAAASGPTHISNGQGYCEACNHAKEAPGWRHEVVNNAGGRHTVAITTPTGHRYRSRAPDPPGTTSTDPPRVEAAS